MTDLLTTVVQSQELKELGVTQDSSQWFWVNMAHSSFDLDKYYLAYQFAENQFIVFGESKGIVFYKNCGKEEMCDCISAFTSQELWDMMKIENHYVEQQCDEIRLMDEEGMMESAIDEANDIDARFRMLVFLLTEKYWLLYEQN